MGKTAFDAIVGARGQITVPVAVRRDLGLKTGDLVDFVENERGQIVFRPRKRIVRDQSRTEKETNER
jgi:AbrB family looped-hinge helix DNA binding protein